MDKQNKCCYVLSLKAILFVLKELGIIMFRGILRRFGFVHESELPVLLEQNQAAKAEKRLSDELAFNNRVFVGMPVIGVNNYENAIEIAIIHRFEIIEMLNSKKIVPVMKLYYSNRTDSFHKDKDNCVLSQYVAFSKQRLRAYLKMDGCERTAMLIKSYQLSTEDIEELAVLAPYQPKEEDVLLELEKTTFFEDCKAYNI